MKKRRKLKLKKLPKKQPRPDEALEAFAKGFKVASGGMLALGLSTKNPGLTLIAGASLGLCTLATYLAECEDTIDEAAYDWS